MCLMFGQNADASFYIYCMYCFPTPNDFYISISVCFSTHCQTNMIILSVNLF